MNDSGTRCHRCGDPITLFVVGDDYCQPCKRDLRKLTESDSRRRRALSRYDHVKDLTPTYPGAA